MKSTDYTSFQLAYLAQCADPDEHDGRGFSADQNVDPREGSAGAQFLREIADGVEDIDAYSGDADDAAHEIADGAVPIYTHKLWQAFVDLAAYNEDPSELGAETDDMTKAAQACLYMIGQRLASALLAEDDEDDEDDD